MKTNFKSPSSWLLLHSLLLASTAKAAGLEKARTTLEVLRGELGAMVPIIAIIALIILGIAYATNFVEKSTFARWAIGLIIAGSAAQITHMLWS